MLPLHAVAVGILAGGMGNLIDRVRQRFVVDFFETVFMEFPVFNVADIYVTEMCIRDRYLSDPQGGHEIR